MLRSRGSSSVG